MQIYFHRHLFSHLSRVPILVEGTVYTNLGGLLTRCLLIWAQHNLLSMKAVHVPDRLNQGEDILSRSGVSSEEWRLYPQKVQIWSVFGRGGLSDLGALSKLQVWGPHTIA